MAERADPQDAWNEDRSFRWRALLLKVRLVGKGGRVLTAVLKRCHICCRLPV